jgi:NADP-dependent 3-hydroxy acid dehydrogenase YdfG
MLCFLAVRFTAHEIRRSRHPEGFRQEAGPNIRSTIVCPGAVKSELLSHITDAGAAEALKPVTDTAIEADAIARAVAFAIEQPADVDVNELIVRPTIPTL